MGSLCTWLFIFLQNFASLAKKKKKGKIEYFVSKFLIFERNYSSKKVVLGQVGYISILDSHR